MDQHFFAAAKTTIFHKKQIIYVNRYTGITFYEKAKVTDWTLPDFSWIHMKQQGRAYTSIKSVHSLSAPWLRKQTTYSNSLG